MQLCHSFGWEERQRYFWGEELLGGPPPDATVSRSRELLVLPASLFFFLLP